MPSITFKISDKIIEWSDDHESILELAEAHGLDLDFGCRMGNCTMCQQRIESGEVDYPMGHTASPDPDHELLCCSIPKTDLVIQA